MHAPWHPLKRFPILLFKEPSVRYQLFSMVWLDWITFIASLLFPSCNVTPESPSSVRRRGDHSSHENAPFKHPRNKIHIRVAREHPVPRRHVLRISRKRNLQRSASASGPFSFSLIAVKICYFFHSHCQGQTKHACMR